MPAANTKRGNTASSCGDNFSQSKAEAIKAYMSTRQVYRKDPVAVLVDAFRLAGLYRCMLATDMDKGSSVATVGGGSLLCKASDPTPCVLFFLSHFHADHYCGISSGWKHGAIYCSRATAALVVAELGVSEDLVVPLDFGPGYCFSLRDGCLITVEKPLIPGAELPQVPPEVFEVRLIPANHCPGAAMLLFRGLSVGCILHTGDFRFDDSAVGDGFAISRGARLPLYEPLLTQDPLLSAVRGEIDILFLDNTFCDPAFCFPPQQKVIEKIDESIRRLLLQSSHVNGASSSRGEEIVHCAVLVGTYFIGKERVALSVRELLLNGSVGSNGRTRTEVHLFASPRKYETLRRMNYFHEKFTKVTEPADSDADPGDDGVCYGPRGAVIAARRVHARELLHNARRNTHTLANSEGDGCLYIISIFLVPTLSVSYLHLAAACGIPYRRPHEGPSVRPTAHETVLLHIGDGLGLDLTEFDGVLAVEATGWAKKAKEQKITERATLLRVPYSEHSSFNEMLEFVAFVQPKSVVPTVSKEQYKACETLFVERTARLNPCIGSTPPITRYFPCKSSTLTSVGRQEEGGNTVKVYPSPSVMKQETAFATSTRTKRERPAVTCNDVVELGHAPPSRLPSTRTYSKQLCTTKPHTMRSPTEAINPASSDVILQNYSAEVKDEISDDDKDCVIVGTTNIVFTVSDDD